MASIKILAFFFLSVAVFLWLSIFGYVIVLALIAMGRRRRRREFSAWPQIAVVIATLNEEKFISAKLENLRLCDYPRDLMTIVVVDGGSHDRTKNLVGEEMARGGKIRLEVLTASPGKGAQINHALTLLSHDIIIFTDADSLLDPSCLKELVSALVQDPETGIVGATITPASSLPEERLHWMFLNFLWWLEGEALNAAGFSAVCYGVRKKAVLPLEPQDQTDDIAFAVRVFSSGYHVRLSRRAKAREMRVPQTADELLRFRRRRGLGYLNMLRAKPSPWGASPGPRLARLTRLWHFCGAPQLSILLLAAGGVLLTTAFRAYALFVLLAFVISFLGVEIAAASLSGSWRALGKLGLATVRYIILILVSLLTLRKYRSSTS